MNSGSETVPFEPSAILKKYDPDHQLATYCQYLREENERHNLVSRETIRDGIDTLVAESFLPLENVCVGHIRNYLDVGSGGGIPAIPIALAFSTCQATLVERKRKKAAALGRIVRKLGVQGRITVVNETFEECTLGSEFDLITLRYVKLTRRLLDRIVCLLGRDGHFVYYSTPRLKVAGCPIDTLTYYYSIGSGQPEKSFTVMRKT